MSSEATYAPPVGPPPPKVPEGWKAQWNEQYKEWFYVNIYTKKSQWERPTEPIYPPHESEFEAPPGVPPAYDHSSSQPVAADKEGLASNNPYASGGGAGSSRNIDEDERLARQLQAEEDARAHGGFSSRGEADSYYGPGGLPAQQSGYGQQPPGYGGQPGYGQQPQSGYYDQQQLPPRDGSKSKKVSFLGKLLGKSSSSSHLQQQYGGYPPQRYGGQPGCPPQQGYYGGGGYPQQYGGRPPKKGGLGAGGAAALGVGGGLVGGMLLADAIDDHDQNEYNQGYDQGYDQGQGSGSDGGGDFGDDGGDFGGDF